MRTMRQWNYVVAAVFLGLGSVTIHMSRKLPVSLGTGDPGSGFWPAMLGMVAVALSVLLILTSLFGKDKHLDSDLQFAPGVGRNVFGFFGLSVLFLLLLYVMGMLVALFAFIFLSITLLGGTTVKERLLVAFCIVLAIQILFGWVLKTPLPGPVFLR